MDEYLPTLRRSYMDLESTRNFHVGDLVLVTKSVATRAGGQGRAKRWRTSKTCGAQDR